MTTPLLPNPGITYPLYEPGSGPSPGGAGFPSGGGGGPSGPTGPATLPRYIALLPPWEYPIPGHQEFNTLGSHASTGAETDTAITDAEFDVPANMVARITGIIFYVTNLLTTSNLTFTVRINNGPVQGYNNVFIFPRAASSVSNAFDSYVDVPTGAKLTVTFSNLDGGTYGIGAGLSGYYWPEVAGKAWLAYGSGSGA